MLFSFRLCVGLFLRLGVLACSSFIFLFTKNKCAAMCVSKRQKKAWVAATAHRLACVGLCVCASLAVLLRGFGTFGEEDFLFIRTDDALPINRLSCRFLVRHIFRCCQYIYVLPYIALVVCCIVLTNIKLHWLVYAGHFL